MATTAALLWAVFATCPAIAERPLDEEQDSTRRIVRLKFGFSPFSSPPLTFELEFSAPSAEHDAKAHGETATVKDDLKARPTKEQIEAISSLRWLNDPPRTAEVGSFALDGYCPVSLQEQQILHPSQRRWTKGDERWGARHEGRVYLFAGPDEQRKFLADPIRYAPVLQGFDPVLVLDRQQKVFGQRQHGVYYEGHTYLFSSEATLSHFSSNPQKYKGIPPSKLLVATIPPQAASGKPYESYPPPSYETGPSPSYETEPAVVEKESTTRTARRGRLQFLRRLRR